MTDHLSEAEIQLYVLEVDRCPSAIGEHMRICEACALRAENYRLVFKAVGEAAVPAVEGDVAGLVMGIIEDSSRGVAGADRAAGRQRKDRWLLYWLTGAGLLIPVTGWFIVGSGQNIGGDIPMAVLYLLIAAAVCVAVLRAMAIYAQYRRQMKNLDLF